MFFGPVRMPYLHPGRCSEWLTDLNISEEYLIKGLPDNSLTDIIKKSFNRGKTF